MAKVDPSTLREAAHEIRALRRTNEILAAKVEVIDVFRAALLGAPQAGVVAPDVAWALDRMAEEEEAKAKSLAQTGIASSTP